MLSLLSCYMGVLPPGSSALYRQFHLFMFRTPHVRWQFMCARIIVSSETFGDEELRLWPAIACSWLAWSGRWEATLALCVR